MYSLQDLPVPHFPRISPPARPPRSLCKEKQPHGKHGNCRHQRSQAQHHRQCMKPSDFQNRDKIRNQKPARFRDMVCDRVIKGYLLKKMIPNQNTNSHTFVNAHESFSLIAIFTLFKDEILRSHSQDRVLLTHSTDHK